MSPRHKSLFAVSLLLCCALMFGTVSGRDAGASPDCEPANQRTISLTVENKAGTPVDNLRAEDLSLVENKTARAILKLERRTNESLSIAILIDASISQERTLPKIKLAAQELVEAILKNPKARATVVSFIGDATVEEDLTNDLAKLRSAIARIEVVPLPSGLIGPGVVLGPNPPVSDPSQMLAGSTAIWDAVWATTDGILKAASDSRRAIVLFSDGEDTSSKKKLSEAIEYAARHDVIVIPIGIADEDYGSAKRDILNKLADGTGGRAFFPKKPAELTAMLPQIDQEIRSQYLLTYCSEGAVAKTASPLSKIKIQLIKSQSFPDSRLLYRRYGW